MRTTTLLLFVCSFSNALAQLQLATPFGDHMVLQRDTENPIWGQARPDADVVITINGVRTATRANANGEWIATLPSLAAGGPYELAVAASETLRVHDVLVGEVWLCSGQSNMEFRLDRTDRAAQDLAAAENPRLRLCTVPRALADTPLAFGKAVWEHSKGETAGPFSAVAYYFGARLTEKLGVPVGLIHSSWGGTAAESWVPKEVLERDSVLTPILDRWNEDVRNYPQANAEYEKKLPETMAQWRKDSAKAATAGLAPPARPRVPRGPGSRDTPSGQWNAMINPLIPFGIRGVIWYQGESNASRAYQYRTLFPALIRTWRERWKIASLPFYYVQLPNLKRSDGPSRSGWPELRESQLMTLSTPNTGMVVTIDVGDSLDLHPRNKRPVGERLADMALAKVYGDKSITPSGPLYAGSRIEGERMRIRFSEIDGGLASRGSDMAGFEIAGSDRVFHPARARVEGNEVVVWSEAVLSPVAVRYAWADNPPSSLMNKAGLPASPFRTDDWPEQTFERR